MTGNRTNEEWLQDLTADGEVQESALADLRDILLRAALFFFSRNLGDFGGLSRDEILQRAEDCAQDALIDIMKHLLEFRGDSKFSTWAYKFAINKALMTARRERWKGVSLDDLSEPDEEGFSEWVMQDKDDGIVPEQSALQDEMRRVIWEVIEQDLTPNQRRVLTLMVFNEVPMDEVVRHLGANRNSVYKTLHDTRQKLKKGMQMRGFEVNELLTMFERQG